MRTVNAATRSRADSHPFARRFAAGASSLGGFFCFLSNWGCGSPQCIGQILVLVPAHRSTLRDYSRATRSFSTLPDQELAELVLRTCPRDLWYEQLPWGITIEGSAHDPWNNSCVMLGTALHPLDYAVRPNS